MKNLESVLKNYEYPGRGIVVGRADEKNFFIAYFIMGRSENSKNRFFELDEKNNLKTKPFKKENIKNEDLIIYKATAEFENQLIISNGNHTETILEGLKKGENFEQTLKKTTYEEDPPILTPRISAILKLDEKNPSYIFSIIKSDRNSKNSTLRFFFEFSSPETGKGHLIHTYKQKENIITNSFYGEPTSIEIPKTLDEFTNIIWQSLNENYKISLFTQSINIKTKEKKTKIINKNI